jgi:hypothetical protein
MIFAIGIMMILAGKIIRMYFVHAWFTDWRDHTANSLISVGAGMALISLLEFASRYLI